MRKIHLITLYFMLLTNTVSAASTGNTLFGISPSETNLYLSSRGSASVLYTVTNHSRASVTPSITLDYDSAGKNLTLASSTCNALLAPAGSCTFRVLISGANQPETFILTPRVCGFNGFICSTSPQAVTVKVTKPAVGLPPRAYEEVYDVGLDTLTLDGININNTSDVIHAPLLSINAVNSVVISPDGSKVYATDGGNSVAFFDVTSDGLIFKGKIDLSMFLSFWTSAADLQMALTPDGSTLFISRYALPAFSSDSFSPAPSLFRINLGSTPSQSSLTVFNNITNTSGLVISPDGRTVYVATTDPVVTAGGFILALPVDADQDAAGTRFAGLPGDYHPGLAIDPAGNTLYVGNYNESSVTVFSKDGFVVSTISLGSDVGVSGLAISSDGATLYVAKALDNGVSACSLDNFLCTSISGIPDAFGLSLSLDGSKLYVAQRGSNLTTTVINTADLSTSSIALSGSSSTIGQFIGP